MTLWLPELIGGIWPDDDLTRSFIRDRFSATTHPDGPVPCEICPARFQNLRNLTLHRRQVHNIYNPTDAKVVMSKPSTGHHSQRLINLAQQTSRIQIARTNSPSFGATPQNVVPHGTLVEPPDYTAMFSKVGGSKPALNRQLDTPEHRGFSSAPHLAWQSVLNTNIVAGPRAPVTNPLTRQPNRTARGPGTTWNSLRPSGLGRTGVSQAEVAGQPAAAQEQTGRRVEALRGVLTHSREGVEGADVPVQGMLHSLEQFENGERGGGQSWPRPPGLREL